MRGHYKVHRIPQQTTPNSSIFSSNPLLSTNLPHSPTLSLPSTRNSLISSSFTRSTTQSSRASHQISPPIILNIQHNLQSPSPLRIPTPNPNQTPLSSPASTSSSSRNTSFSSPLSSPSQLVNSLSTVDVAGTEDEFRGLLASRIELCTSLQGLDSLLSESTVEWLRLSTKPEDTIYAPRRPKTSIERTRSQRNQNRQQQKIRSSGRNAAEKKANCNASTHSILAEPAHFDRCEWKNPTSEELRILSSPPGSEEIKHRLGKACNTAHGRDGLEYRHLRALDTSGHLLASIYRVVWTYRIPACWKTSRTVPIYKNGNSSDYGNFRPTSLLPTMYKIFS
ncbi:Uncharacterized protein APZ42_012997 [Daphnia magna]|uniref:Uncharacterized protein n=1 Tax=Daphnia magna TaxID=35525 RepID=A0A162RA66_9CRUS|nr:Uncharacterized protein APZ42_012997 [Daphnia magna]